LALAWLYFGGRSVGYLAGAVLLILFGLLVRATPVVKTLEDRARELGALAVLNGGILIQSPGEPTRKVNIFASAERWPSKAAGEFNWKSRRADPAVRRGLEPARASHGNLDHLEPPSPQTKISFPGFFAEHLARV
jgi:hypothetical protein